ncbi:MAG: hypothetical protein LKF31_10145 [Muribaculaceae bacterium]|jgi:hypothetical protein|nr:hypothetical protein [Muribaculaceae bacterium]
MNRQKDDPLTKLEKFCIDSYLINKDADFAYLTAKGNGSKATEFNLHRIALRWLRSKPVEEYLKARRGQLISTADTDGKDFTKKENVIGELSRLAVAETSPTKRAAILMQIADLQRLKQEDTAQKQEERRVHYYLPLTCNRCALRKKK